jgi:ferredoxin-type protein NapH
MMQIVADVLRGIMILGLIFAGILAILIWKKNQTKRLSLLRLFIQVVFVPLIFIGLIFGPFGTANLGPAPRSSLVTTDAFGDLAPDGLSVPVLACYYPSGRSVTCPIWQIQSYIFPFWEIGGGWDVYYFADGLVRLAVVFALVIVLSVVLGRVFCGWICPFGLYMDLLTRLRAALKIRYWSLPEGVNRGLRQSRYLIIAAFLVLSFMLGSEAIMGTQLIPETQRGEYLYDYFSAPFCQVCPMRPLSVLAESALGFMNSSHVFSSTTGQFYEAGFYVTSISVAVLVLVTVGSFMVRRLWCRICPLGGLISLFDRFPPFKWVSGVSLSKVEEKCTKCGICKRVCPTQVTKVYDEKWGDVTAADCIMCFRCVEMCPYEGCLNIKVAGKSIYKSRNWLEKPKLE